MTYLDSATIPIDSATRLLPSSWPYHHTRTEKMAYAISAISAARSPFLAVQDMSIFQLVWLVASVMGSGEQGLSPQ